MKSLKPLLLVLAGVLITVVLFSFKNEEPKKEYCRVTFNWGKGGKIYINYPNKADIIIIEKNLTTEDEGFNLLTRLNNEGWKIISTSNYSYSTGINPVGETVYLERTK